MHSAQLALRYIVIDLFGGILRWPFWWYSRGLILVLTWMGSSLAHYVRSLSLGVWMKNLFVPMFGMRDWQSRIISFFMRLFQIFGRLVMTVVWAVLLLFLLALYIAAPIISVGMVIYHFIGAGVFFVHFGGLPL